MLKTKGKAWLVMPVVAVTIASLYVAIDRRVADQRLLAKQTAQIVNPIEKGSGYEALSLSLLTDSILSIIQSYYVDQTRVTNRKIAKSTFESLRLHPKIQSGTNGKDSLWMEIDGARSEYPMSQPYTYASLLETFQEVARLIDDQKGFFDGPEKGMNGSLLVLDSLLSALDAHSALLTPDAYRELRQGTEGSFGGLGVLVGMRDNVLTVVKPLPRSPAIRSGIKKDDKILGINGVYTYGYTLDDLVEHMRGPPGSEVNLSLLRKGDEYPKNLSLKREIIHVDSVSTREISYQGAKILHLTIENFSSRTSREVLNAIKRSKARHNGLHGVVLDLRSNPGGLLDQAVQVVDLFIKDGVIVTTKGRHKEIEVADTGFDEVDFPVAVLINEDSASASEIVAGALQDHGRAVVVGQPSFGKGSVQTIFELPGERALKLTIARYYTPSGRSIQNTGIMPDIWLQPVYKEDANKNLLGTYRYKNERYLRNHLSAIKQHKEAVKLASSKGYYLIKDVDEPRTGKNDRELNVALKILGKMAGVYGKKMPESANRSSHWLALAAPEINRSLGTLTKGVSRWIQKQHKIDWNPTQSRHVNHSMSVTVDLPEIAKAKLGSELVIPWHVANNSGHRVEQISVFVRSEMFGFETSEILVGGLDSGATRDGKFRVKIPSFTDPGVHQVRVGVAVGAWPIAEAVSLHTINVSRRPMAELVATVTLVNEKGGKVKGVLEPGEKAEVEVLIQNIGKQTARQVEVHVDNISGTQVQLEELSPPSKLKRLHGGDKHKIRIPVVGGARIFSTDIGMGVFVDSPDVKNPFVSRVAIKGMPNSVMAKVSNLVGH